MTYILALICIYLAVLVYQYKKRLNTTQTILKAAENTALCSMSAKDYAQGIKRWLGEDDPHNVARTVYKAYGVKVPNDRYLVINDELVEVIERKLGNRRQELKRRENQIIHDEREYTEV